MNYVDIEHPAYGGRQAGSFSVEFFHVGVNLLPEPAVLDGYLFGFLLLALECADQLVIDGPISAKALRNAQSLSEAWHCWFPDRYQIIEILPSLIVDDSTVLCNKQKQQAAIAAFSGGVDSTFTALRHLGKQLGASALPAKDLLMVHGFDVSLERESDFQELVNRTRPLIEDLGAHLHIIRTNLKHTSLQNWEHAHMAELACCLHQFSYQATYGIVGSSYSYSRLRTGWGSHPGIDHLLSGANFEIFHDGAGFTRSEKIEALSKYPLALKTLKVCWEGEKQGRNCGKCNKCVQTRLNLYLAGVDADACFDSKFELGDIRVLNKQSIFNKELLEAAVRQGAADEWINVLRDHLLTGLRLDSAMRTNENKASPGSLLFKESRSASVDLCSRLSSHQVVVAEFVKRESPVWLLTSMPGNIGDHLIWQGTEKMLVSSGVEYRCISKDELQNTPALPRSGTLVIPGSGALTTRWHEWLPDLVFGASSIFDRVVILPSQYDPEAPLVTRALSRQNVYAFAREAESFRRIKCFGRAALAPDPALWALEFPEAIRDGRDDKDLGVVLVVLRTDVGSLLPKMRLRPAAINNDISLAAKTLEEFLRSIDGADAVVTDRLHVAVAAVALDKDVRYIDPYDKKISRYIEYNLRGEFASRLQRRDEQWLLDQGFVEVVGKGL